jgi:hypothetical protein
MAERPPASVSVAFVDPIAGAILSKVSAGVAVTKYFSGRESQIFTKTACTETKAQPGLGWLEHLLVSMP